MIERPDSGLQVLLQMPLRKKTDTPLNKSVDQGPSFFVERAPLAYEAPIPRDPDQKIQGTSHHVGRYFADYSELTAEEIAQTDRECEELFKYSRPVSGARAPSITGVEYEELLSHSRPVSAAADNIELELADLIKHSKPRSR